MKQTLLNAAFMAACLLLVWELIAFGLAVATIISGQSEIGGGPAGLSVQVVGMMRSTLHGMIPPAILLIAIEIYRGRRA